MPVEPEQPQENRFAEPVRTLYTQPFSAAGIGPSPVENQTRARTAQSMLLMRSVPVTQAARAAQSM